MLLRVLDRQIQASSGGYGYGNINDFWYGGAPQESDTGISITPENAMRISTVWKCVNWRAEQFAKLPKKIYERATIAGAPGRKEAPDHRLYRVVHTTPNGVISSMAFWMLVSMDLDLYGNSYAWKQKDAFGRVVGLWRLLPDAAHMRVVTKTVANPDAPEGKETINVYCGTDNQGVEHSFYADEILHFRGLGYNSRIGYSPIEMQRQSLGYSRAASRFGGQFFKNASRPSAIVSIPNALKPEKKKELIEQLSMSGKKAGAIALIEGAMTMSKWGFTQDEAQFIETMQFNEEDIAGIFKVKPHKIGIMRNMTNNNVEQQNIEAVTDCIHPLCENIEQWFDMQMFSSAGSTGYGGGAEIDRFYFENELKGMMRGDMATRSKYYQIMVGLGVMSPNMVCDEENMERFDGGDVHLTMANMTTLKAIAMDEDPARARQVPTGTPDPDNPDAAPTPAKPTPPKQKPAKDPNARFIEAYAHVFRDAVGRTAARKNVDDRTKSAAKTFFAVINSLAVTLGHGMPSSKFMIGYLGALTKRAEQWNIADVETITQSELTRAADTFGALIPEPEVHQMPLSEELDNA